MIFGLNKSSPLEVHKPYALKDCSSSGHGLVAKPPTVTHVGMNWCYREPLHRLCCLFDWAKFVRRRDVLQCMGLFSLGAILGGGVPGRLAIKAACGAHMLLPLSVELVCGRGEQSPQFR